MVNTLLLNLTKHEEEITA